MTPLSALFIVTFLEGYIVLSTELLAIRLLIPFTGSGTDTVSIVIAAVLLPLAFGYYAGGKFKAVKTKKSTVRTIRKKLIFNLVTAGAILTVGLSYVFLSYSFGVMQKDWGWYNRIWLTSLYSALFVIAPVYLLGQTVPLISNYFSRQRLPAIAGKILFFSTLGSFIGAVFSTLVLMTFLGVHYTVSITIFCITAVVFILAKKKLSPPTLAISACLALALALNSGTTMSWLNIVSNNKYSTVQVIDYDSGVRALKLNNSFASAVYKGAPDTYFDYTIYIEDNFLAPIFTEGPPKSILILGTGGFTIGRQDTKNNYTYVDIDSALKKIAEEDFLREKLTPNKKFVPMDARAYLLQSKERFDVIVLDLFRDPVSVPENLATVEFFQEVRAHLQPGGIVVGNYWASPVFADPYSRNLDKTLHAVFPNINRQVIDTFNAWQREGNWRNIIYSYVNQPEEGAHVYTDNKNTIILDRPAVIPPYFRDPG